MIISSRLIQGIIKFNNPCCLYFTYHTSRIEVSTLRVQSYSHPMNVIQEIQRINKAELQKGLTNTPASWHAKYANSAWVYAGGLPTQLTEGDIIAVMSQWGEIEDINLVREEGGTGKSRGFCFVKYEDCRSCVLAVDNFNGSQVLGKTLRVDHVENYRLPKHLREKEEDDGDADSTGNANANDRIDANGDLKAGHAYHGKELKNEFSIHQGQDLFAPIQGENKMSKQHESEAGYDPRSKDDEKIQRKAERDRIRREREVRRQEKEENRRQKRASTLVKGDDAADDGSTRIDERERGKKRHKKSDRKRQKHRKRHDRSRSRSRSVGRTRKDSE